MQTLSKVAFAHPKAATNKKANLSGPHFYLWRRWESNPRPKILGFADYMLSLSFKCTVWTRPETGLDQRQLP